MSMRNHAILIGRLTKDPDIRQTQSGTGVTRFTLAIDRTKADENGQREADFIPCIAFGQRADFADRFLTQGTKIGVIGHIQTGSYTKQDGTKVYTTDVIVDEFEFVESKNSGSAQQKAPAPKQSVSDSEYMEGFMNIPDSVEDEGLPFS